MGQLQSLQITRQSNKKKKYRTKKVNKELDGRKKKKKVKLRT